MDDLKFHGMSSVNEFYNNDDWNAYGLYDDKFQCKIYERLEDH